MKDCEECGERATHRRIEGWDPRTTQTTDVDVDYSYWCTDHATEDCEELEPEEGDEGPAYGDGGLREQIEHARDMRRWDNHPDW